MPGTFVYRTENPGSFKTRALLWASGFETACYFDSNNFTDPYSAFDVLIAAGTKSILKCQSGNAFDQLGRFLETCQGYLPGFFSYDLKNETEDLRSENPDFLQFPDLFFFEPKHLIIIKKNKITIHSGEAQEIAKAIEQIELPEKKAATGVTTIKTRFSKQDYMAAVYALQQHIRLGDIYEVNLCQEFYLENFQIHPLATFLQLNRLSPAPFSNFFKTGSSYIISATPERFLSKRGSKLISQPIKGTAKRHLDIHRDENSKNELRKSEKERAENVMIVDLVRNDLTKSAVPGSVKVEELFGIYSFSQVHQLISTVVCQADARFSNAEIIKNSFPMGSMTGAPKVNAMKLIDQYERSRRGIYSGAAGYFSPSGDFDFNVLIRSLFFNSATGYLSFQVGSAITIDSDPEKEYKECLLKAEAILEVLGARV